MNRAELRQLAEERILDAECLLSGRDHECPRRDTLMDTDTLVDSLLDDGRKLVTELPQRGFEVMAAFWLKPSVDGKWYFYIVSPLVDAEGSASAYGQLHPLLRTMPPSSGIDPWAIKLIGPSDPVAKDVLAIDRRSVRLQGTPIRWPGIWLGNLSIEGAYLYLQPANSVN